MKYYSIIKLLEHMQGIVNRNVKYYKTDFYYDITTIMTLTERKNYIWIVRESGTHLFEESPLQTGFIDGVKRNFANYKLYELLIDPLANEGFITLKENTLKK